MRVPPSARDIAFSGEVEAGPAQKTGQTDNALVPRTRSSHASAARAVANFGFKRGTRIIELLVSLGFRSSHESVLQMLANFGIGTLVPIEPGRAQLIPSAGSTGRRRPCSWCRTGSPLAMT